MRAKDKVYDAAGNVKPYVERAMNDDKLEPGDQILAVDGGLSTL